MDYLQFYPKTIHLPFSKEKSVLDVADAKEFEPLVGKHLVFEEKVDGQAVGIFFDGESLHLLFRGQYFCPDKGIFPPKELQDFTCWCQALETELYCLLQERYIMYGEWLQYRHTVHYDKLPSLFMEYDIFDKSQQYFLCTPARQTLLQDCGITSVHVHQDTLIESSGQVVEIINTHKTSQYKNDASLAEGFYIKEENAVAVVQRYKWIEPMFFNEVVSATHWREKKLCLNALAGNSAQDARAFKHGKL